MDLGERLKFYEEVLEKNKPVREVQIKQLEEVRDFIDEKIKALQYQVDLDAQLLIDATANLSFGDLNKMVFNPKEVKSGEIQSSESKAPKEERRAGKWDYSDQEAKGTTSGPVVDGLIPTTKVRDFSQWANSNMYRLPDADVQSDSEIIARSVEQLRKEAGPPMTEILDRWADERKRKEFK